MPDRSSVLDRTFRALGDANRRAILDAVRAARRPVGEIADELGLSQQIVSHHLKVLRTAGLVADERVGTRHLFRADPAGMAVGRAFFEQFWPERLAALKRAAEHGDG
jgi:DNA-binding transcriptional ArsR family regulator